MQLGDGWNECLGGIPKVGVVAIWGHSGNGKSGAAMSLCKECGAYGKVLYVASEEGFGASLQNTVRRYDMASLHTKFQVCIDSFDELMERLEKRESAHVVVIDSPQAMGLKKSQFHELRTKYAGKKLIIFVCQAEGKQPKGKVAQDIIIRPLITEESMAGTADKKYTFVVAKDANKIEIKAAVEKLEEVYA